MENKRFQNDVLWMMEEIKKEGAAMCSALSFDVLRPRMSKRAMGRVERFCPNPSGVLTAVFPYFAGAVEGNLSLYARGLDYHLGITRRLEQACARMKTRFPDYTFLPGVDASPLPERAAALCSGLGVLGQHGLVICPPYGSYVFLGTVLMDYPVDAKEQPVQRCRGCGSCVRACPSGALSLVDGEVVFDGTRCLSHLTQKKKGLTGEEEARLQAHPYLWGCDLCQLACPENRDAACSPLADLTGQTEEAPYLNCLTPELLEGLDEAAFQEKFGNRAFAWRGLQVLKRNLELQLHKSQQQGGY